MFLSVIAAVAMMAADPGICSDDQRFCAAFDCNEGWNVATSERHQSGAYVFVKTFVTERYPRRPLISNDGRYLVFAPWLVRDETVTILRGDGTIIAELPLTQIITENDLTYAPSRSEQWSIRSETLVLSILAEREDKPDAKRGDI